MTPAGRSPASGKNPEYWVRFLLTAMDNLPAGTQPDWAKMATESEKLWQSGPIVKRAFTRLREKYAATLPVTTSNAATDVAPVPATTVSAPAKATTKATKSIAGTKRGIVIDDSADNNDPEPPAKKRVRKTKTPPDIPQTGRLTAAENFKKNLKKNVDDTGATAHDGGEKED